MEEIAMSCPDDKPMTATKIHLLISKLSHFLFSLRASPVGRKDERDGRDNEVSSLPKTRSYATDMKYNIIALHLFGAIQFLKTPHHVQHKQEDEDASVSINCSQSPASITYVSTKGERKTKLAIHINVPVGSQVFVPALVGFDDNTTRDRVLNAVKKALENAENQEIGGVTVIAPADS